MADQSKYKPFEADLNLDHLWNHRDSLVVPRAASVQVMPPTKLSDDPETPVQTVGYPFMTLLKIRALDPGETLAEATAKVLPVFIRTLDELFDEQPDALIVWRVKPQLIVDHVEFDNKRLAVQCRCRFVLVPTDAKIV